MCPKIAVLKSAVSWSITEIQLSMIVEVRGSYAELVEDMLGSGEGNRLGLRAFEGRTAAKGYESSAALGVNVWMVGEIVILVSWISSLFS